MINNPFCEKCLKTTVCTWAEKLSKLEGTEKKPCILDITIDACEEFVAETTEE
jgi:hypothetical protein